MSEQKPEKKVVSRTVAIAIGIIAIVLLVGLVGAMVNYNSIINEKDNTITTTTKQKNQLQTLLNGNATLLGQTQTWLNGNFTALNQTEKWLSENETLLGKTQTWLDANKTLLDQTKTWLKANITYYNSEIANLMNQNGLLKTWLNGNNTEFQAKIASLNAKISQLQNWLYLNETYYQGQISNLNSTIVSLNSTIVSLNNQITSLNNQVSNLRAIVNLQDYTYVAKDNTTEQGNGQYSYFSLSASYAGYVSVYVQNSTVAGTLTEVAYSANEVNYNQEITVDVGSLAAFPVLPATITIGVGNEYILGGTGANETVTITYYY